jgi:hypothetical protein
VVQSARLTAAERPGPGVYVSRRALALFVTPELLRRARIAYRADALYEDLLALSVVLGASAAASGATVKAPEAQPVLTTAQFAAAAHIKPRAVRRACQEGRIHAIKRDRDWQIPLSELTRWEASH